ncbi:methylase of polypeptide subunit release factors [Microbacterium halimionae]|uniref:site-specific DNA-methyltransferase (adenine-specific) n=1 Tax=Microbacterium halimionae TaxID=1526413 RepID=A0A7W3PLB5_9MICO|nr:N-6 DNA methylase [Microbacterium halimionae]MBA8815684.1 methylase of polypeptide subunit release factors [Microbacterium halimionae]NII95730.1 methylase of polypeptide subunit release factors [Microbacterium halimionae]
MSGQVEASPLPGVVYTRPWVARFILDLVDYQPQEDLSAGLVIDPGCGDGTFLVEIVKRLLESSKAYRRSPATLVDAIRAFDIDVAAIAVAKERVGRILSDDGVAAEVADLLVGAWIREADFLLTPTDKLKARWIVGNPPYVRLEDIDAKTYKKYRDRWSAMSGRADVYIGFFQAGLSLLEDGGRLAFICADRWMHNQYGSALRRDVIDNYAMDLLLEVHDVDVFATCVAAYPAITVMRNGRHKSTAMATARAGFDDKSSKALSEWFQDHERESVGITETNFSAALLDGPFEAASSWPSGPPERLFLIADLERRFPSITEVGVTIGVGMATGADKVYVVKGDIDIEPEQLKPALGPSDLVDGKVSWSGRFIVSPWADGKLIDLDDFPKLKGYFVKNRVVLSARYVARRKDGKWWRTIDRPRPDEYADPKLIVADINDRIEPVLDKDAYWPLHSAYFIKSDSWDLEALGGYLLSDAAAAFVEAYSVKMANGHLRISAQYLKRIRAPHYEQIPESTRVDLISAFRNRDRAAASAVVATLFSVM